MNEVLRQEKKFLINQTQLYLFSRELMQVMINDPHNRGDGYPIRSLYFDSLDDRDFEEKDEGVELRRKIRLRNYGADSSFAMLEMKQKEGAMQKKRSVRLERDAAIRLTQGDYTPLLSCKEPFAQECYAVMRTWCYLPRVVVEYRRIALIARENKIRVTFDHHLIGTEANTNIFDPHLPEYPVWDQNLAVMEVKYNGFLLSYIKDLIRRCEKSELSVSKYALSRTVSKHYLF